MVRDDLPLATPLHEAVPGLCELLQVPGVLQLFQKLLILLVSLLDVGNKAIQLMLTDIGLCIPATPEIFSFFTSPLLIRK
jgi:hypothetical protein